MSVSLSKTYINCHRLPKIRAPKGGSAPLHPQRGLPPPYTPKGAPAPLHPQGVSAPLHPQGGSAPLHPLINIQQENHLIRIADHKLPPTSLKHLTSFFYSLLFIRLFSKLHHPEACLMCYILDDSSEWLSLCRQTETGSQQ